MNKSKRMRVVLSLSLVATGLIFSFQNFGSFPPGLSGFDEVPGFEYLATSGNQIVGASSGKPIKLTTVVWQEMETNRFSPAGLYARNIRDMMKQMRANGFNSIRLTFSIESLYTRTAPTGINFTLNPELRGLSALQIMDYIVDYAGFLGMTVIPACHRRTAGPQGAGTEANGLWYENGTSYTEDFWVASLKMLAERYRGNSAVTGFDLFNEPHAAVWGGGGPNDWARASERAGNAILAVDPTKLIFVGGIAGHRGLPGVPASTSDWWGLNLQGVATRPVRLNVPNRVVYSPHPYPRGVTGPYPTQVVQSSSYPFNMPAIWDQMFGYIYKQNLAPIWIGEFAANPTGVSTGACQFNDPSEAQWLRLFLDYIKQAPAGKEGMSWTWWSFGFDSCGRFLFSDVMFAALDQTKLALLRPVLLPAAGLSSAATANSSCLITQPTCPNFPAYVGTFADTSAAAKALGTDCLKRADDYYAWCGGSAKMLGHSTTATYRLKSVALESKTVTYPCKITQPICPNSPAHVGTFADTYAPAKASASACMLRAADYYAWCGGAAKMGASKTRADFYLGSSIQQTRSVGASTK